MATSAHDNCALRPEELADRDRFGAVEYQKVKERISEEKFGRTFLSLSAEERETVISAIKDQKAMKDTNLDDQYQDPKISDQDHKVRDILMRTPSGDVPAAQRSA